MSGVPSHTGLYISTCSYRGEDGLLLLYDSDTGPVIPDHEGHNTIHHCHVRGHQSQECTVCVLIGELGTGRDRRDLGGGGGGGDN